MRFALLHHGDPLSELLWSGIPLNIVRTLRQLGHEVDVVGNLKPENPLFSRIKTQFYRRVLNKIYLINRDPAVFAARAKAANERLKALGPLDAILITYLPDAVYLETDVPIVIVHDATWTQLTEFYPGSERARLAVETVRDGIAMDKKALALCRHAIYSSQWAADSAIRDYGVAHSKVSVVQLGSGIVDPPAREDVARYLKGRLQGPMQLFFLGREWYRKGGDIAVALAAEIEAIGVAVQLHVAGCIPDAVLPAFVRVHGPLRKDIPEQAAALRRLFERSDLFLMPTRADAFGMVYGESAAFGTPVIAGSAGGVPEIIGDGEWGKTTSQDTPLRAIAEWAVGLYKNRTEYERLAWQAREAYETRLNWPVFCRKLVEITRSFHAPANGGVRSGLPSGAEFVQTRSEDGVESR